MESVVVTGIHTEVGKSVVAMALSAGLGWPYWKPLQTGSPRDTDIARQHHLPIIDAAYSLEFPGAPLIAARLENVHIGYEALLNQWQQLPKPLIVEGAGGLFVPITEKYFFIDFFHALGCPILLVVRPYLGAMNHTWLSLRAIAAYRLPFLGIILCGCPILLVVRPYLGAMNHTWLSLRAIAAYRLPFLGIILCGTTGNPSETYFRETFADILLGEIPFYESELPKPHFLYEKHLTRGIERAMRRPPTPLAIETLHKP